MNTVENDDWGIDTVGGLSRENLCQAIGGWKTGHGDDVCGTFFNKLQALNPTGQCPRIG